MKNIPASKAVSFGKSDFSQWLELAPTKELNKVFEHCSFATNAQKWEQAKIEIAKRRHKLVVWSLIVMVVTAVLAGIAALPVFRSWF